MGIAICGMHEPRNIVRKKQKRLFLFGCQRNVYDMLMNTQDICKWLMRIACLPKLQKHLDVIVALNFIVKNHGLTYQQRSPD